MQEEETGINIEVLWGNIRDLFTKTGEERLGYSGQKRKEWISLETWDLIDERKELKKKMISAHQSEMVEFQCRYAQKNREVKRRVTRDKRTYIEGKAEEAELAARKGDSRMLYKITKELSGNTRCHTKPVKNAKGETITDKDGQLAPCAEHFACILNKEAPRNPPRLRPNAIELPINTDEPTPNEIRMAIEELKNNKAAGSENVAAKLLKADITTTTDMLYPLFKVSPCSEKCVADTPAVQPMDCFRVLNEWEVLWPRPRNPARLTQCLRL